MQSITNCEGKAIKTLYQLTNQQQKAMQKAMHNKAHTTHTQTLNSYQQSNTVLTVINIDMHAEKTLRL